MSSKSPRQIPSCPDCGQTDIVRLAGAGPDATNWHCKSCPTGFEAPDYREPKKNANNDGGSAYVQALRQAARNDSFEADGGDDA